MRITDLVVWVLFVAAALFLGFFLKKRMGANKEYRREAAAAYAEKQEKYAYLEPGILTTIPREDISAAVLFQCMRKEDEDFEHYFENMNFSEKVIFGIYQASLSLQGRGASLHSFFLSPSSQPYVPIIVDVFEEVGAHDIADLMKAARRFAEIIENDEEDEDDDPEMGDYSRYNFSDFTNEFITLVTSSNLNEKLTNYILEHENDFYNDERPEETIESGDDNDEGISE